MHSLMDKKGLRGKGRRGWGGGSIRTLLVTLNILDANSVNNFNRTRDLPRSYLAQGHNFFFSNQCAPTTHPSRSQ